MKYQVILFLLFTTYFATSNLHSQTISQNQISSVNVDDLSDEQIRSYWDKAKEEGYTLDQLEPLAAAKGMSQVQIAKLRRRILALPPADKQKSKEITETINPDDKFDQENELFYGLTGKNDSINNEKSLLFGYDFFNNANISFEPNLNLATPSNYQLGPGDEIIINIWGAAENTYQQKVSSEGSIRIESIGPIFVSGLSIEQAKEKINSRLKKIYSGISANTNSPYKVHTDIALSDIRRVQVNIIGEVKVPGTYTLSALSTVLNALYAAGGPTENGTFRNIRLVRNGEQVSNFDIYKFLVEGIDSGNEFLKDQDVIIVNPYEQRIKVEGAAKRPGIYEVRDEETFEDLSVFFGGFTSDAYKDRVMVERVTGSQRSVKDVVLGDTPVPLKDGDKIIIGEITNRFENKVSIEGAVYRPGIYELNDSLMLSGLFKKAMGVKEEALIQRAILYRVKDGYKREAQSFSILDLLNKEFDLPLRREDSVFVFDKNSLKEEMMVSIDGAVNEPKTIDYIENLKVEDMIALAGGFKDGADVNVIDISRRLDDGDFQTLSRTFKWSSTEDLTLQDGGGFTLKPFDRVSVRYVKGYSAQKEVMVEGEVSYPGNYTITSKNDRVSDLLSYAGGLSPFAYIEGATLVRKKNIKDREQQQELLEQIGEQDSIFEVQKPEKDFRIGLNLKKILENGGRYSKYDIILEEGDILTIPSEKQTVEVRGEILAPSLIRYDKTMSLKEYINNSGGFTSDAKKGKTYVIYANGEVKATKNYFFFKDYPRLEPGSVILVPPKAERRGGLSIQEVIGITTGLGTISLIIDRLSN
ncbi:MAG: SLBB domain-containing protein, partial [Leeuwenhoekiella sp.]